MTYFDNAATTFPKPKEVVSAVQDALLYYGANPGRSGHKLSIQTARKVYETREALAEFFGAGSTEEVVFTQNCTHSLNLCLKGVLTQGDHVIISDIEHNSVLRPVHTLANRGVVEYNILTIHEDDDDTIAELRTLIRPNTKLIALAHGSNVFGILSPIARIAEVAKENDVLFLVDAAQSAGVVDINVTELGIDFLCMPGHKSLYGPTGTGVIVTCRGDMLQTIVEGGTGSVSLQYEMPDFMPDKLEAGTVGTAGIIGLGAGVEFVNKRGINHIYDHEMQLTAEIYNGLMEMENVTLYTPRPAMGRNLPVLAFNIEGKSGEETCDLLDGAGFCLRGGFHCSPLAHKKMNTLDSGVARLSLGAFNTQREVRRFLREVQRLQA